MCHYYGHCDGSYRSHNTCALIYWLHSARCSNHRYGHQAGSVSSERGIAEVFARGAEIELKPHGVGRRPLLLRAGAKAKSRGLWRERKKSKPDFIATKVECKVECDGYMLGACIGESYEPAGGNRN